MPDPSYPGSWIPDPKRRGRLVAIAATVVRVLTGRPGIGMRQLRAGVRGALGKCTDTDTDAALFVLGDCVERTLGARGAHHYRVDIGKVPTDVRACLATLEGVVVES